MNRLLYPLTIIADRYGGTYSGGAYLAFNLEYDEIPKEICDSDMECFNFWQSEKSKKIVVGKGEDIYSAYLDLAGKIVIGEKWKMMISLEEFLFCCCCWERLVIFNESENIEDRFEYDEIPESWLSETVKDFGVDFSVKCLWIKI